MKAQIAGLGTVVIDQQIFMDKYPEWDTKNSMQDHCTQVGGPVPTALVFLSRLGHKCGFVGKWSDDLNGYYIEDDLRKEGVLFNRSIRVNNETTGFASVWVEAATGRRTTAYTRGSFPCISAEDIDESVFSGASALHLDGWSSPAAITAAAIVKAQGGKVFLDAGSPKSGLSDLIPLVDVMICPRGFAGLFFNDDDINKAASRLLEMGAGTVVFTSGENGSQLFSPGCHLTQKAFKVKAVDTNGAGDVFCGALIHALQSKFSCQEALRFASAAAALKCTRAGNRKALPKLQEIKAMMESE